MADINSWEKNMKKHRKCKKIIAFVTVLFIAFVAVIGLHKTGFIVLIS